MIPKGINNFHMKSSIILMWLSFICCEEGKLVHHLSSATLLGLIAVQAGAHT